MNGEVSTHEKTTNIVNVDGLENFIEAWSPLHIKYM